jgi:hypothetical protein
VLKKCDSKRNFLKAWNLQVALTCKPSYSAGGCDLKSQLEADSLQDPISKKPNRKKGW